MLEPVIVSLIHITLESNVFFGFGCRFLDFIQWNDWF